MLRLGLNIDHIATVRNARGENYPDPVKGALIGINAGVDGITAHLREDRRHVQDDDLFRLKSSISVPLNFEMAATQEMQSIALNVMPNAVCLVPEKREEVTTEGGLDVVGHKIELADYILPLKNAGIRVSLFVDPDDEQLEAAQAIGADIVELHTGAYCHLINKEQDASAELMRIKAAANMGAQLGLEVHAGHGICYKSVSEIAAIPEIVELNIGHFLIAESIFLGLDNAVKKMKQLMSEARAS
ncbi:pyridoxine 5'-phosphate synthase [Alphaproteobacteria bacterium]|jgi:pyridoxine 5-phosphate synthase|nr:pyridoxine 5'-phosphate synthase [Alphaproteobacteria bacterium]